MGELLLLILVVGAVALAVAWPLLDARDPTTEPEPDPEREASVVRHRLALEALRDIEADRRAGSTTSGPALRGLDAGERAAPSRPPHPHAKATIPFARVSERRQRVLTAAEQPSNSAQGSGTMNVLRKSLARGVLRSSLVLHTD